MSQSVDLCYLYDGTYDGLLTCVFESYRHRELPAAILPEDAPRPLCTTRLVPTDPLLAARVTKGLSEKVGARAEATVRFAFLTILPDKEMRILAYIRKAMKTGPRIQRMIADETVYPLYRAVSHMREEAHLFTGFLRFSEADGILYAVIDPKNQILPLIADHFADRFPRETFLIYDETHGEAMLCRNGEYSLISGESFAPPPPDRAEREARALWTRFFETLSIAERKNPLCQRTHLPLRYRTYMTEFLTQEKSPLSAEPSLPPLSPSGPV